MIIAYTDDIGIKYKKSDIEPYCYVLESDMANMSKRKITGYECVDTDRVSLAGEKVVKITMKYPKRIGQLRMYTDRAKITTFEADVPFGRRYMIDKDWCVSGAYRKLYYDIETHDNKINSIGAIGSDGNEYWMYGNEEEVVSDFLDWVKNYDLLLGWNNIAFDRVILDSAILGMGLRNPLQNKSELDVMNMYKKYTPSPSYTLKYVGDKAVGMKKLKLPVDYKSKELQGYNMRDVEITKEIDEKFGLSDLRIEIAKICYVFPDETMGTIRPIDGLMLKKAKELGLVLPNVSVKEDFKLKGAEILEPVPGVHYGVSVMDFKSLYPNIIINERLSPDKDRKLLPGVLKDIMDLEEEYKRKYKETKDIKYKMAREALKILRNSMYGSLKNPYCRLFNKEIVSAVTAKGRKQLLQVQELTERLGFDVIAGDTDSIMSVVDSIDRAKRLETYMCKKLKPYVLEFEKYFDPVLFTAVEKGGVKKRYAGYDIINGEKEFNVVGLEMKRSDSCDLMRQVQENLIKMILDGGDKDDINFYLAEVKKGIMAGNRDIDMVFSRGIKDNLNDYKVEQPHVRAARKLLEKGIKPFGKVQYVITTDGEEPVIDDVLPGNIDRQWYYEQRIVPLSKRLKTVYETKRQSKIDRWI